MRSYTVNMNHIGSAVSEILQYRQTHIYLCCYFIIRMSKIPDKEDIVVFVLEVLVVMGREGNKLCKDLSIVVVWYSGSLVQDQADNQPRVYSLIYL